MKIISIEINKDAPVFTCEHQSRITSVILTTPNFWTGKKKINAYPTEKYYIDLRGNFICIMFVDDLGISLGVKVSKQICQFLESNALNKKLI